MFSIPALPPWNGLHPIVVHFPIALVLITPVLVATALLWKQHTRAFIAASAVVMVLGAAGAWLAVATGSAAEELAERVPAAKATLEQHEHLAEAARNFATALAAALVVATLVLWKWSGKAPRSAIIIAGLGFLAANAAASLVIANAAHEGGRLVHEFGVLAPMASSGAAATAPPASRTDHHESGDRDD